jgi:hypothetical protein
MSGSPSRTPRGFASCSPERFGLARDPRASLPVAGRSAAGARRSRAAGQAAAAAWLARAWRLSILLLDAISEQLAESTGRRRACSGGTRRAFAARPAPVVPELERAGRCASPGSAWQRSSRNAGAAKALDAPRCLVPERARRPRAAGGDMDWPSPP